MSQIVPGLALTAQYSPTGDSSLPPQATLYAVPATASPSQSIDLLWDTLNVAFITITGNNGVDYQPGGLPSGLSGFISTSGSGFFNIAVGFTATITITLTAYDATHTPLGLTAVTTITII